MNLIKNNTIKWLSLSVCIWVNETYFLKDNFLLIIFNLYFVLLYRFDFFKSLTSPKIFQNIFIL